MMAFIYHFPLMVVDGVPENDEVWIFFLNFLEIVEIALDFNISNDLIGHLAGPIRQHHLHYVRLFNDTLKPKHYFIVHYPLVIRMSGVPRNYWCFQFEAKHKKFNKYERVINSRRHIPITLSFKFQLKFAQYLLNETTPEILSFADCYIHNTCNLFFIANYKVRHGTHYET